MKTLIATLAFLACAATAYAVPVLQVGAPGPGMTDPYAGPWATYQNGVTPPPAGDEDTAVTSGNILLVAGTYQSSDVIKLGSWYSDTTYNGLPITGAKDWSGLVYAKGQGQQPDIYYPTVFDNRGAILVVTIPNGSLDASGNLNAGLFMTVDGSSAFYKSLTDSWFPNNHAPVGDGSSADYLFFDIGSFDRVAEVPNFDPDDTGDAAKKQGEILALSLALTGFSWAHFDVIALQTSYEEVFEGRGQAKTLVSYLGEAIDENNPGSHDVTWKPENGGGGQQEVVPEPGTIMLLGTGLIGLALYGRRRMK